MSIFLSPLLQQLDTRTPQSAQAPNSNPLSRRNAFLLPDYPSPTPPTLSPASPIGPGSPLSQITRVQRSGSGSHIPYSPTLGHPTPGSPTRTLPSPGSLSPPLHQPLSLSACLSTNKFEYRDIRLAPEEQNDDGMTSPSSRFSCF